MRKFIFLLFLLIIVCFLNAQYKVQFILFENTTTKHDNIYITGNFNNWDSTSNKKYRLIKKRPGLFSITLNLKPGTYNFKYTRGNWNQVEKGFAGEEVYDRKVIVTANTILNDTVQAWRDEIISDKWNAIASHSHDSILVKSYYALANIYSYYPEWYNIDSGFHYIKEALLLLQKMKNEAGLSEQELNAYNRSLIYMQGLSADLLHSLGNFSKELELRLDNIKLAQQLKDSNIYLNEFFGIASTYASMKDYNSMLHYSSKIYDLINNSKNHALYNFGYYQSIHSITVSYFNLNKLDSALYFVKKLYASPPNKFLTQGFIKANADQLSGDIYFKMGKDSLARQHYNNALPVAFANYAYEAFIRANYGLARIMHKWNEKDSALFYAKEALQNIYITQSNLQTLRINSNSLIAEFVPFIAQLYRDNNQPDSAYHYLQLSVAIKDSLYNLDKIRQFQNLGFNETLRSQQQQQEMLIADQRYEASIKIFALIAGLGLISILAIILFRNNRMKQKANEKIEKAYTTLRTTQAQLIQSEKMASLGELTAGIAHEIQNPLNFVNNFSEINTELLYEMKDEINKGNYEEVKSIADDVINNEQKINYHGKRADGIVKGMLQHSRNNNGIKELTDINVLADEYLRLAYHGLRAKDKSFNANYQSDFDDSIEKINVVPQDIGRVLLNLITNAFYAVSQKKKHENENYHPTVTVSTKKMDDEILVSVTDNGNGIPAEVVDKIFQPFFTTKPTGQGTGLGLSMSYDIIKAHGGELKVETNEGEGTTFYFKLKQN